MGDTVNNEIEEIMIMVNLAEKFGATVARNSKGQVEDIFFTPYDLIRYTDFIVSTTLDNYVEIQDPAKL